MAKNIIIRKSYDHKLPYKEALDWEEFQFFTTDMLALTLGVNEAREYLMQGNDQQGIDIYATTGPAQKMTVAQCKLVDKLTPANLKKIVKLFLSGSFADKTDKFILVTNVGLSTKKQELALDEIRNALRDKNIELIVWDKHGLDTELRTNPRPQIVLRYFGPELANAFYGSEYTYHMAAYQKVPKKGYKVPVDYIERKLLPHDLYLKRNTAPYEYYTEISKSQTLIDLLGDKPVAKRITLLSIAGFGKTFEVENLAAHFSQGDLAPFPIRIYLRDYNGQEIKDILDTVEKKWQQIDPGTLLLLFDGLDEVTPNFHDTFIKALNLFLEGYPNANVVVSSRFNFYDLNNPPLREFDIRILDSFSEEDIQYYVQSALGAARAAQFFRQLSASKLLEYNRNPFYLTRIVKLFSERNEIPRNKADLLRQIISERFSIESQKHSIDMDEDTFWCTSRRIATVMTQMGKTTLSDSEIKTIVTSKEALREIKLLSLINKGEEQSGMWSFEHKNIQEYLCATFFKEISVDNVLKGITYPYSDKIVQPHFVNTLSFLFSITEAGSSFATELAQWLLANQPELLVRFERDRITSEQRFEIFKSILSYYKKDDLGFYTSNNFRISELAEFIDWNDTLVSFIDKEMNDTVSSNWYVYDCISLVENCPKKHVFKNKLQKVLLKCISTMGQTAHIQAHCIGALKELSLNEEEDFKHLLSLGIDITNFEIRHALIDFIKDADYSLKYYQFILDSIPIFKDGQRDTMHGMANENLTTLIAKFSLKEPIKAAMQVILLQPGLLELDHGHQDLYLSCKKFEELAFNAVKVFNDDKRLIVLMYRIYLRYDFIPQTKEWFDIFYGFFEKTCGIRTVFNKFYRYGKRNRDLMEFADKNACDFLMEEYAAGRLTKQEFSQFRNVSSHINNEVFLYFNERLKTAFNGEFYTARYDWNAHRALYAVKNQQLLLDRSLFVDEIEEIFRLLDKDTVKRDDFYHEEYEKLLTVHESVALKWLRQNGRKATVSKDKVMKMLNDDEEWQYIKIEQIKTWLEERNSKVEVNPELLTFAQDWCKTRIHSTKYENCIVDKQDGCFSYNGNVVYLNSLFVLCRPTLEDDDLLKMLEGDLDGFTSGGKKSVSDIIIEDISDTGKIKSRIMENFKKKLASPVLMNHFRLSDQLHLTDASSAIFTAIVNPNFFRDWDKRKATEYYLNLGGDIIDFKEYLFKPPINEDAYHVTWNWMLIEEIAKVDVAFISQLLVPLLFDGDYEEHSKDYSAELLFRNGRQEGLAYWFEHTLQNKKQPFDISGRENISGLEHVSSTEATKMLTEILVFSYVHHLNDSKRFFETIERAMTVCLSFIAMKGAEQMTIITNCLSEAAAKYKHEHFGKEISFKREKILQDFYNSQINSLDVKQAIKNVESFGT